MTSSEGRDDPAGHRRRRWIQRRATSISMSGVVATSTRESLLSLLSTPPMMADRRLVVVRDVQALKKDARACARSISVRADAVTSLRCWSRQQARRWTLRCRGRTRRPSGSSRLPVIECRVGRALRDHGPSNRRSRRRRSIYSSVPWGTTCRNSPRSWTSSRATPTARRSTRMPWVLLSACVEVKR